MNCLELQGVQAGYGPITVLRGLSLQVKPGEVVTLIGANGAGKSTTLRTASLLLKPKAGKVEFLGQDITRLKPHQAVAMGMAHVPEGRRVFPQMTVGENILTGGYLVRRRTVLHGRLEHVLNLFPRLEERLRQQAATLSGGEQQMLAIARALMQDPQLILMDEPSMGLAPVVARQIFAVIATLKKEGKTILLVEQNANLALAIADRGYVLQAGSILLQGAATELAGNQQVREAYLGV